MGSGQPFGRTIFARHAEARTTLLAVVVLASVGVRAAHLLNVYSTPSFSLQRTAITSDMYIFDQWAQRIVEGDVLGREKYHPILGWMLRVAPREKWAQWFGDAPAFFKAPLYAYLVALLRWCFGDAMLALAMVQILASTLTAVLLFAITEQLFDTTAAFLAAALFAVYAPAIHYDVVMLRGPWIALTSLLVTWQLVRVRQRPTPGAGCLLGLAVALALLFNEGFLILPPLVLLMLGAWVRELRGLALVGGGFVLGLALGLTPVVVRNLIVGVPPLQLAVTGSFAYAMYNAADTDPLFFRGALSSFTPLMELSGGRLLPLMWACIQSFHHLGELDAFYLRRAAGLIVPFENPDNVNFYYAAIKDPLLRVLPTYAQLLPLGVVGIALAARKSLTPLLPVALALLASLMLTAPLSRFRVAFALFLFPFAGITLARAIEWGRARRAWSLGTLALGIALLASVAGFLQRRVVFNGGDASTYFYRPAEFRLAAAVYSKDARFGEAIVELSQLGQLNASPSVRSDAWLRAAQLQLQTGDTAGARVTLQSLSATSDHDPKTLLAVGDAYWHSLNDIPSALDAYRRAAALQPGGRLGEMLRSRLAQVGQPRPSSQLIR